MVYRFECPRASGKDRLEGAAIVAHFAKEEPQNNGCGNILGALDRIPRSEADPKLTQALWDRPDSTICLCNEVRSAGQVQ